MSDALGLNSLSFSTGQTLHPNRFLDIGRRSRSRSREQSPSVASETPRSSSRLRFSLNMTSNKNRSISAIRGSDNDSHGKSSSIKKKEDEIESVLSTRSPQEPGTPAKPLMFFRGGASWNCLPRDMQAMGLDLFWPVKLDKADGDYNREVLHIEELAPLCQFRGLRVLKITGMLQSYQKYIWQAAWLNTALEELELGMAIGPRIRRNFQGNWPCIKGGWSLNQDTYGEPVY